MAEQFYTDGDVRELDGRQFECVSVSYKETDGEKHDFVYGFRLKSELDAEREAAKQAEEGVEAPAEVTEPENKEETLNVR